MEKEAHFKEQASLFGETDTYYVEEQVPLLKRNRVGGGTIFRQEVSLFHLTNPFCK